MGKKAHRKIAVPILLAMGQRVGEAMLEDSKRSSTPKKR